MTSSTINLPVLFIGGLPLPSAESSIRTIASMFPSNLVRRIPDGETGDRHNFTAWIVDIWPNSVRNRPPPGSTINPNYQLRVEDVGPSRYDEVALESYEVFKKLREEGVVKQGTRFQICLPSPMTVAMVQLKREFQPVGEVCFESKIEDAIRKIQDRISAEDLAIQWDCACEAAAMDWVYGAPRSEERDGDLSLFELLKPYYQEGKEEGGMKERIAKNTASLVGLIREGVEVGVHLCYGDMEHQRYVQPRDLGLLADLMEGIEREVKEKAGRRMDWWHVPLPKGRDDEGYFKPLKERDIGNGELYLGLVHFEDQGGTDRRAKAARRVLGISSLGSQRNVG